MKTIKIKFVDFWDSFNPNKSITLKILSKHYNVVLSDKPDYVFFNCNSTHHFKYDKCVKIFYTGENIVPDFNTCDYAIGFSKIQFLDRYIQMPLFLFYPETIQLKNDIKIDKSILSKKDNFCSFVYSNRRSSKKRFELFNQISRYKRINSGGKIFNNQKNNQIIADKNAFQSKHKFSIACENSSSPGYLTEKLIQSFVANTIPIYWGDPCVKDIFNEKAFINVNDYNNYDELIEKIKEIDNNDSLYINILNEKKLCNDHYIENMYKNYENFLINIFNQNKNDAIRRNMDCLGAEYQEHEKIKSYLFPYTYKIYKLFFFWKQH